ncbi:unknown protein [Seminavis robusta]|uniref:Uncharacterized protein n=1 Tax=Seminavis robusta TaxID=568900 RepID=A0A9N8HCL8_9STRA|nr:unknown protein [Seminavis robusta]|eukprot:Sro223_g091490.1 n/a (312) ;mRNA; f:85408-86432
MDDNNNNDSYIQIGGSVSGSSITETDEVLDEECQSSVDKSQVSEADGLCDDAVTPEQKDKETLSLVDFGVDDEDNNSHDQSLFSVNSAEARERAIQDGFLAFLTGYVQNDVFARFMEFLTKIWGFLMKKIGRGQSDGDDQDFGAEDLAEELMDIADPGLTNLNSGFNTSMHSVTSSGGGGGGTAPGPPPGVAEMASAAANSAASGAASGAAAGAGAATAGGLGGLAGMAGAVAGAGAATQGGIAMGVAAVTAAVVSTGVTVNNVTMPVAYDSTFVPPVCSEASVKKIGFVELQVQALPPEAIETRKSVLEE